MKEVLTMSSIITVAFSTFKETSLQLVLELLRALGKQTVEDFDVTIVVDGNRRYFRKLVDEAIHGTGMSRGIDIVFNPVDRGISHSRNIVLQHTKTRYVAYTDDDAIPHPSWLQELLLAAELDQKVAAVAGPVLPMWEKEVENHSSWFPKELYWIIGCTPFHVKPYGRP